MRFVLCLISFLLSGPAAETRFDDRPPPNEPPEFMRATAEERNGRVVIRLARAEYDPPRKAVSAERMRWRELKPVTLGRTARAFTTDGNRAEPKDVLKALAKPAGVAVFVRFGRPPLDPDPYYLAMLRPGVLVLVVEAGDIADPIP